MLLTKLLLCSWICTISLSIYVCTTLATHSFTLSIWCKHYTICEINELQLLLVGHEDEHKHNTCMNSSTIALIYATCINHSHGCTTAMDAVFAFAANSSASHAGRRLAQVNNNNTSTQWPSCSQISDNGCFAKSTDNVEEKFFLVCNRVFLCAYTVDVKHFCSFYS